MQLIQNDSFDKPKRSFPVRILCVSTFFGHLAALCNFNFLCVRTVAGKQCNRVEKLIMNILCGQEDCEAILTLNKL